MYNEGNVSMTAGLDSMSMPDSSSAGRCKYYE